MERRTCGISVEVETSLPSRNWIDDFIVWSYATIKGDTNIFFGFVYLMVSSIGFELVPDSSYLPFICSSITPLVRIGCLNKSRWTLFQTDVIWAVFIGVYVCTVFP